MSAYCQYCGAVASRGHELGHESGCPTLMTPMEFSQFCKEPLGREMMLEKCCKRFAKGACPYDDQEDY